MKRDPERARYLEELLLAFKDISERDDIKRAADRLRYVQEFIKIECAAQQLSNTSYLYNDPRPPPNAEKILCFLLPPEKLEERVGDFEEGFRYRLSRDGIIHARHWYWCQVWKVAGRCIFSAVCKVAKIWAGWGSA